jgi:cysteine desulfurase
VLAPDMVVALDLAGVAASAGSACASGAARPSAVLAAMGFAGSGVRFSVGVGTTEAEIDGVLRAVERCLPALRENG